MKRTLLLMLILTGHFAKCQVIEPQDIPLIAYPLAWSPPTNGELVADVVYLDAASEADFSKFKGQLNGKIVLLDGVRKVEAHFEPLGRRWNDFDMGQVHSRRVEIRLMLRL